MIDLTHIYEPLQQHILHQRPVRQEDLDVHIRSLLCHHGVHSVVSQLQNMVVSWSADDLLHCLVLDHCSNCSWPGNIFFIETYCPTLDPSQRFSSVWTNFGQIEGVTHSGPTKMVLYFTGATNILYTFGGHAVTVWVALPLQSSNLWTWKTKGLLMPKYMNIGYILVFHTNFKICQ